MDSETNRHQGVEVGVGVGMGMSMGVGMGMSVGVGVVVVVVVVMVVVVVVGVGISVGVVGVCLFVMQRRSWEIPIKGFPEIPCRICLVHRHDREQRGTCTNSFSWGFPTPGTSSGRCAIS
jgi:hypothetical protein